MNMIDKKWANWHTRKFIMWIASKGNTYRAWERMIAELGDEPLTGEHIVGFAKVHMNMTTPDFDKPGDIWKVNFQEIADSVNMGDLITPTF